MLKTFGLLALILLTSCGQSREALLTKCEGLQKKYNYYADNCGTLDWSNGPNNPPIETDLVAGCKKGEPVYEASKSAVRESKILNCRNEFPSSNFA